MQTGKIYYVSSVIGKTLCFSWRTESVMFGQKCLLLARRSQDGLVESCMFVVRDPPPHPTWPDHVMGITSRDRGALRLYADWFPSPSLSTGEPMWLFSVHVLIIAVPQPPFRTEGYPTSLQWSVWSHDGGVICRHVISPAHGTMASQNNCDKPDWLPFDSPTDSCFVRPLHLLRWHKVTSRPQHTLVSSPVTASNFVFQRTLWAW